MADEQDVGKVIDKQDVGMKRTLLGAAVFGAIYVADRFGHDGQFLGARKKARKDREPNIAEPGEKVIAIEDIDGHGVFNNIKKGGIYTVRSYRNGYYCFMECETVYNPYLGKRVAQVFNANKIKRNILENN